MSSRNQRLTRLEKIRDGYHPGDVMDAMLAERGVTWPTDAALQALWALQARYDQIGRPDDLTSPDRHERRRRMFQRILRDEEGRRLWSLYADAYLDALGARDQPEDDGDARPSS